MPKQVVTLSAGFKFINFVLYPDDKQKPIEYVKVFSSIYDHKLRVKTYGDRHTFIRTFEREGDNYHGVFCNAVFIPADSKAVDSETNEIVQSGTDPKKGLGVKEWEYWFFPKFHRMAIKATASQTQILKFLNAAFAETLVLEDSFSINVEVDKQTIDKIVSAPALTRLYVKISYTNNDNLGNWQQLIDEQLRKMHAKDSIIDMRGTKSQPIDVGQSEMARGYIHLSRSNGYVEASLLNNNGSIDRINTKEHPRVEGIAYEGDPITALESKVQEISNNIDA